MAEIDWEKKYNDLLEQRDSWWNFVGKEKAAFEDLLSSIWLYIPWKFVTGQLTTVQKNLFADAIDKHHARTYPYENIEPVERWWEDG